MFLGDGGGVVQAVRAPIVGAAKVGRVLAMGLPAIGAPGALQPTQVNGCPALVFRVDGEIDTVITLDLANGLITGLYAVRNPAKLSRMGQETALSR